MEIDQLFGLPAGAGEKLEDQVRESDRRESRGARGPLPGPPGVGGRR